ESGSVSYFFPFSSLWATLSKLSPQSFPLATAVGWLDALETRPSFSIPTIGRSRHSKTMSVSTYAQIHDIHSREAILESMNRATHESHLKHQSLKTSFPTLQHTIHNKNT